MNTLAYTVLVGMLCLPSSTAKNSSPKIQVYTRIPGDFEKENTLICHVSGFHPPEINIMLLKNNLPMVEANQTDLAFEENWHFYLTKHATFTPRRGDAFACRVTHLGSTKIYHLELDM